MTEERKKAILEAYKTVEETAKRIREGTEDLAKSLTDMVAKKEGMDPLSTTRLFSYIVAGIASLEMRVGSVENLLKEYLLDE